MAYFTAVFLLRYLRFIYIITPLADEILCDIYFRFSLFDIICHISRFHFRHVSTAFHF